MLEFQGQLVNVDGDKVTIRVSDTLLIDTLESFGELLPEVAIGLVDGRTITPVQRRKAYATMRDMAEHLGYTDDEMKQVLKSLFYEQFGSRPFSFANTDVTTTRMFISFILEVALDMGIPLRQSGLARTDDLDVYMLQSMRHRKCALCGKPRSDIHHVDAIGRGNDRRTADHRDRRMICLCREHHNEAHNIGWPTFSNIYHVIGVEPSSELIKQLGLMTQQRMDEIDGTTKKTPSQ